MIHELRHYRVRPGQMETYMHLIADIGGPVRGDDYGRLAGFWLPVSGDANEVMHLWEHESLESRQRLRVELFNLPAWAALVEDIAPRIERQTLRLMSSVGPFNIPAGGPHTYELLTLSTGMGGAKAMAPHLLEELPNLPGSCLVGVWHAEAPDPNEIVCLIAHADMAARLQRPFGSVLTQTFLARHEAAIVSLASRFMIPARHSPMQ